MKLAFSTNAYKQTNLETAIESIASIRIDDARYTGVEIMADVPHAYPRDMFPRRIDMIREKLDRLKLSISNVNAFTLFAIGDTYHPTWIDDNPLAVEQRVDHTHSVIGMSAALGAKTISLQPGGPLGRIDRQVALGRYREGLETLLPYAQQHGVMLMIEPEPGLLIQHSWECIEFLEQINHPNLKMNCDLGHFYCVNEDPAEVVRACAKWIAHVHLEDIKENRVHQHHIPGTGAMDFAGIFGALREVGYGGWVTVELYPFEMTPEMAARRALEYLRGFVV